LAGNQNLEKIVRVCFNPGDIASAELGHIERRKLERRVLMESTFVYGAVKTLDAESMLSHTIELNQAKANLILHLKDQNHVNINLPNNNAADNFVSNNPGNAQACGSTRDGVACNNRSVRAELKELPEFITVDMKDWTEATTY